MRCLLWLNFSVVGGFPVWAVNLECCPEFGGRGLSADFGNVMLCFRVE